MKGQANLDTQSYPKTVSKAVQQLMTLLSSKAKEEIRRTPKDDLAGWRLSLGTWIDHHFGLCSQNQNLLNSCKIKIGIHQALNLKPDHAAGVIIESLWEILQKEKAPSIDF